MGRRNNPLDSRSTLEPTGRKSDEYNQDDPTYHNDNKKQTPLNRRRATKGDRQRQTPGVTHSTVSESKESVSRVAVVELCL